MHRIDALTVKLANRYIIRSLRCFIESTEAVVEFWAGLGVFATPLEAEGFDGRCVMGLVPWVHAFWAGAFL
jgi:hypothetical protein